MSRYTPPTEKNHAVTSQRFKGRPAWVRFGAWACVFGVVALVLTSFASLFI